MELIQKKLFNKKEFRISDSKLYYSLTKFGNKNEVIIPYEEISGEKVSQTSTNFTLFTLSLTVFLVGVVIAGIAVLLAEPNEASGLVIFGSVLMTIGALLFILFLYSRESFWKIQLSDSRNLFFHQNIPDQAKTEHFISELLNSRNVFLRQNYMIVDKNLNYESQLNTFRWLKSIHAINQNEFEDLYNELKKTVDPLKTNIGFRD